MTNKSSLRKKPKRKEMSDKERIRDFQRKLYRKAKQEKSQRKSKLCNQGAFDKLVKKYGMTDPSKYQPMTTVKA